MCYWIIALSADCRLFALHVLCKLFSGYSLLFRDENHHEETPKYSILHYEKDYLYFLQIILLKLIWELKF